MLTFDSSPLSMDAHGNMQGVKFDRPYRTCDGRTVDSTGAFLVGELERLDQKLHEPLASVTWSRDIDLRQDVTIADEVTSFTISTYGAPGGLGSGNSIGNGKSWIGRDTTQIQALSLDIAKIPHPLRPWGQELKYTILELESAAKLGRPIDSQKLAGIQLKHQMDIDEQVYIGDTVTGDTGMLNNSLVSAATLLAAGASGYTQWAQKTPNEILFDVNQALTATWASAAWAVMPSRILIPPFQYGYISTTPVTLAGTGSILKYLLENNLLTSGGLGKIEIFPCKWNIGAGLGGTIGTTGTVDRMMVYTKDVDRIRFPMTILQKTPVQYDGIYQKSTYFCRLGVVEAVYPETVSYWDGLVESSIKEDPVFRKFDAVDIMGETGYRMKRKAAIL